MAKYVFILGGVVSSLGKGIASASLGALLQSRGYKVRMRKMDPYLNIDPGTMSPYQHGEVFVTDDGAETDLDLGHYERFVGISCHQTDSISGGKIHYNVLNKERRGEYLGATVQMIPHVTDEIKNFIRSDITNEDFVLYEVGGTVGDIEGTLFLEAARQFANEVGRTNCCFVYLTLLPYIETAGELKTKPTQQAVKKLLESGIQADVLLCRSKKSLSSDERRKLSLFCNVSPEDVVAALDVDNIYKIPLVYHEQGLDVQVLKHFGLLEQAPAPDLKKWSDIIQIIQNPEHEIKIAAVGKYCGLLDAYKSLNEAISHGGIANKTKVKVDWIDSEGLEPLSEDEVTLRLKEYQGILVPGGFGTRGIEGKIKAITYARTHKVPFLGICLGMQMAVIEACRNLLGIKNANSSEMTKDCTPVINRIKILEKDGQKVILLEECNLGGTMRLGAYPAVLKPGTLISKIYEGATEIKERHRHRYEMDISYEQALGERGFIVCGKSSDGLLPEVIEISEHPFFIACQFHPELKSKPFAIAPLFRAFVKSALEQSELF